MADRRQSRRLTVGVVVVVIAAIGIAVWLATSRLNQLGRQLEEAETRAGNVEKQLARYSDEVTDAIQRAEAAKKREAEAESAASAAEQDRTAAQLQAEQAQQAAQEAQQQATTAHQRAEAAAAAEQQTRSELETIRKRREDELNRMQEALNRIAPTRRTPAGMVMELADDSFHFDFDKASLRPENREVLSRIAGVLLASEGYRLFVYGHTDDVGTREYNQNLSERRAQTIRDYLVQAGIPSEIITTQGFGKSSPAVKATSSDARAKNRRVELGIVDTIINYQGQVTPPKG